MKIILSAEEVQSARYEFYPYESGAEEMAICIHDRMSIIVPMRIGPDMKRAISNAEDEATGVELSVLVPEGCVKAILSPLDGRCGCGK